MAKKKGESSVKIYQDWCKGCGICVAFCPAKVLRLSSRGKAEVVNEDECINCGFCEVHCPDFAIMVYPRNSRSRADQKPDAGVSGADAVQEPAGPEK
ncbi:4Fe-4S dicluster domain-containing protein [Desulfonatronovibrio hydrogenovorans]|uniref:4Fe-4S dicluster domain-containing protein n=1 Tax=Desulfonatronovibrio hydrogenovorans TaxID=53245 RepID=UPI0005526DBB|nr:4Fe-4S dicluster domain-containing protein [Desulfonatronovibrio hydrogenovorans]